MNTIVITLPDAIQTRSHARGLTKSARALRPQGIVVDAGFAESVSADAADELVRGLLNAGPQRVILANASASLLTAMQGSHRRRARPENTFLLVPLSVSEESLLRA